MIKKPKQYYDTRRHQLYYQWSESEYFSHQEPIYDRTREYIEALEADNAKLRELVRELYEMAQPEAPSMFETEFISRMHELGIEVDK